MLMARATWPKKTCKQIYEDQSLYSVEDNIVPVKEVFRLQNANELMEAGEITADEWEKTKEEINQQIDAAFGQCLCRGNMVRCR